MLVSFPSLPQTPETINLQLVIVAHSCGDSKSWLSGTTVGAWEEAGDLCGKPVHHCVPVWQSKVGHTRSRKRRKGPHWLFYRPVPSDRKTSHWSHLLTFPPPSIDQAWVHTCKGTQGPCTQRETLRELGLLIMQGCLLMKDIKPNTCIPSRKLRLEVVHDLVTFLLSVGTNLTLIPQNDYPRLFPLILMTSPSPHFYVFKEKLVAMI